MKFSQRQGITPTSKPIQVDSVDDDLRNGLWNGIKTYVIDAQSKSGRYGYADGDTQFDGLCSIVWHHYFKLTIDSIPDSHYKCESYIKQRFYKGQWFEVYDFLEFLVDIESDYLNLNHDKFKEFCNGIFERDFAGYRFIDGKISPIINEHEIKELEESIGVTQRFTSLKGANIHLTNALSKISDRKNPDYRNSIKESISAIESVAKIISNNSKDSLGGALDKIKGKIKLHAALERGFKQLYGYTSDSDGIRHALTEEPNCDFEDAKYMLVSCSAFINYLVVKADKAGIKLT
jgi:hypothetical protein